MPLDTSRPSMATGYKFHLKQKRKSLVSCPRSSSEFCPKLTQSSGEWSCSRQKNKIHLPFACIFLCIPLPDSPSSLATKKFINNDCRISQIRAKSGNKGVHFDLKFEAAVKILAPNRKCIFKSPVRGCRGCGWFHLTAYRYKFRTCSKWIRSGVNASLVYDMKTARL